MPRFTIDRREIDAAPGTTVLQAALENGIHIQYFCWHPDLPVDGNCRTCMIEVEKMPKLQIACNTVITDGMVVHTDSPKAREAQRTALEFLLLNHPIDCPVCDQAGECYLQDNYMLYGLYGSKVELEDKVSATSGFRFQKVVDLGPIVLDSERCVHCSRCIRFESQVTRTNLMEFRWRADHMEIATFEDRPITHAYAGNLAEVCPVGALLSRDFRFKMRVWFLKSTESVCPGCSTGCNVYLDHRDGEVYRLRGRRNPEVNKSWLCDPGRAQYTDIAHRARVTGARLKRAASWEGASVTSALDVLAAHLGEAGDAAAFVASPQATNEDLLAFRTLAETVGGLLDFRVGDPQLKLAIREDEILLRADKNPNTQGCLDQGLGRAGIGEILAACRAGSIKVVVLQGPELLRIADARSALALVPFIGVMATHEDPHLDLAHAVLPASVWAEVDGTFTNYQRRVQRIRAAVPSPGDARPRWELAAGVLARLGSSLADPSARGIFRSLSQAMSDYRGLDYSSLGSGGRELPPSETRSA
jgi:NADH-quinone oxidoreductase subunit G